MTCERCGATIQIGEWPFCPHGRGTYAAIADDIPGGLTIENLGPTPVTVYSHTERRRIMRARGLRECDKGSGHAVCETTLANARSLVSGDRRGAPAAVHPDRGEAQVETLTMTVTERAGFRVPPDGEPYIP